MAAHLASVKPVLQRYYTFMSPLVTAPPQDQYASRSCSNEHTACSRALGDTGIQNMQDDSVRRERGTTQCHPFSFASCNFSSNEHQKRLILAPPTNST